MKSVGLDETVGTGEFTETHHLLCIAEPVFKVFVCSISSAWLTRA